MTEKSFIGGMIIVGLVIFLTMCMTIYSCQPGYKLMEYDVEGMTSYTCCPENSTSYDLLNDICVGAPGNATKGSPQQDFLENIKDINPQIYIILIVVMMGFAVFGVMLMIE